MRTVTCQENNIFLKILCVGLALQSYYFIIKMVSILKMRMVEYTERKRKGVKLRWFHALDQKVLQSMECYSRKKKPDSKLP